MIRSVVCAAFALCVTNTAHAEVVGADAAGFSVKHEVASALSPQQAYDAFVQIHRWWSDSHTYSGSARNLSLRATPGGCWCETLPNGGFVRHMSVEMAAPGRTLRFSGGLGPLGAMGVSGVMTVQFAARDGGSTIALTYVVSGRAEKGWAGIATAVDGVLGEQTARLAALPAPPQTRARQR